MIILVSGLSSLSPAVYRGLDEEEHGSKKRRKRSRAVMLYLVCLPAKPGGMSGLIREWGGKASMGQSAGLLSTWGRCYLSYQ